MKIIISIPAYNEEKTLPEVLKEIKQEMGKTNYNYEILVVNDGSEDLTEKVAKEQGAKVVSNERNLGLAETFKREMKECIERKADIIIHTDADGQYKAKDIPRLVKKVEEGYDLVLGSRFYNKIKHMPLMKRFGNKAFARVFTRLTKVKLTDTTTGFRAFTRQLAESINYINTFTYTQEQIIRAAKQHFKITEIPIETRKTRESRLFKSPLEYAFKAWINILRIYRDYDPVKFFGKIGLTITSLGVLIGIYFTYLHFTTGIKGHLGLLVLMIILLVVGIQIALFGLIADMLKR